ncbi:PREDICTED: histone-lysine N-methyltransferase SETMAR-like [Habropoda laboriosa]|uniref:histone-lysine N-methyltransferase SETMAR-like n=1 Tax=Habropoda laboriosa TaxID=597456 RepID=UPI00083DCB37|nr:PREDICTED: histone-lysine N-methyltransferase SETMAR-like [Habropoda laboriosa]
MLKDRRVTVRELCEMIPDVSKTCIDTILTDHLGYAKVCARWVPRMLTEDHKRQRVEAAREFLQAYETDGEDFLDSIVTGDETCQWKHPESPKPRKFKQTLSVGKAMASVFWNRKGLLLCEFMPAGTTNNADRYCVTLKNLRRAIQNRKRGMLTKGVRFHQDNARPYIARVTTDLINKFGWDTVTHPPYSPDIAPSDYHLFPELKKHLGGTHFRTGEELKEEVLRHKEDGTPHAKMY